jgi:aminoglycoside phosphotransferase (APT) family kinase protein
MPEWDADLEIDASLVRALLEEQFPDLDASSARLLAEGWDNAVWVVEERWAFRFPRREIAVPLVARELAVLPAVAPLLPIPVPAPELIGAPDARFPRPFFGAPLLPGRELADVQLSDRARDELAVRLGEFLRALHAPDVREQADPERRLPLDPNGRADMAVRIPRTRERLAALDDLADDESQAAEEILRRAEDLPPSSVEALVHGDFHVRHVLIADDIPSGVIDWGDVCVGDPSIDLQLAWALRPPERGDVFLDAYGRVDDETRLRARVLAVFFCALLANYARAEGLPGLERETRAGLTRALAD